jgi:nitrite reductase/ring-hydroxylating ferredoxin subunit
VNTGGFGPLRRLRTPAWREQPPSWADAKPAVIEAALGRALCRASGNWFVLGATRELDRPGRGGHRPPGNGRPLGRTVAGLELVAWRDTDGTAHAGPGACPHLGAPLCSSAVVRGRLVCHWHGLALDADGRPGWRPYPTHDDGVLVWVRLDGPGGEPATGEPVHAVRPPLAGSVVEVVTATGRCEPADVLANRLDPWHGSWLHPYAFANLSVLSAPTTDDDRFVVEVAYRVGRSFGVPVIAEFACPGPRAVVMRIVDGDGAGSVVETHATPLGPGADGAPRTAVIEATIAYSDRPGFRVARTAAPLLRPLIRQAAARLWRDDLDYAERRYDLRSKR